MNKVLIGLISGLFMLVVTGNGNTAQVTILNNYAITSNTADIVHIGDDYVSYFIVPYVQGSSFSFDFTVPTEMTSGTVELSIDHFHSNLDLGYFDHVVINGHDLGYLSDSYDDWVEDIFQFSGSILGPVSNTLKVSAGTVGLNYDDLVFTNLKLTSAVPIPGAIWLFGTALIGLVGYGKRKSKVPV